MLAALLANLNPPTLSSKLEAKKHKETRLQKIHREDDEILELLTIITMSGVLEE